MLPPERRRIARRQSVHLSSAIKSSRPYDGIVPACKVPGGPVRETPFNPIQRSATPRRGRAISFTREASRLAIGMMRNPAYEESPRIGCPVRVLGSEVPALHDVHLTMAPRLASPISIEPKSTSVVISVHVRNVDEEVLQEPGNDPRHPDRWRGDGRRCRHRHPRLDGARSHRPRAAAGAAPASRCAPRPGARRRRVPRRRLLDALARDARRRLRRGGALAALRRRLRRADPQRPGVCAAHRSRGAVRGDDRAPHGSGGARHGRRGLGLALRAERARLRRAVPAARHRGSSSARAASRSSSTSSRSPGTLARSGRRRRSPMSPRSPRRSRRSVGPTSTPRRSPQGEQFLEVERGVEAHLAPVHIEPLERAMPWTSAHLIDAAGGVDFGADAIAGYFEALWGDLLGDVPPTRVAATAPFDGQANVPATGWAGGYSPGSNEGNRGGLTRIAAALSSALPYPSQAGQGSVAERASRGCGPPARPGHRGRSCRRPSAIRASSRTTRKRVSTSSRSNLPTISRRAAGTRPRPPPRWSMRASAR